MSGGVGGLGFNLLLLVAASTGWVRQVVKLDKTNVIWQMATGRNAALSTVHTVPIASLPAWSDCGFDWPDGEDSEGGRRKQSRSAELICAVVRFALRREREADVLHDV